MSPGFHDARNGGLGESMIRRVGSRALLSEYTRSSVRIGGRISIDSFVQSTIRLVRQIRFVVVGNLIVL